MFCALALALLPYKYRSCCYGVSSSGPKEEGYMAIYWVILWHSSGDSSSVCLSETSNLSPTDDQRFLVLFFLAWTLPRAISARIKQEFSQGHSLSKNWFKHDFDWAYLFKRLSYSRKYPQFLKICLSAFDQDQLGEWLCLTKLRFPTLLLNLEQQAYGLCDPIPQGKEIQACPI